MAGYREDRKTTRLRVGRRLGFRRSSTLSDDIRSVNRGLEKGTRTMTGIHVLLRNKRYPSHALWCCLSLVLVEPIIADSPSTKSCNVADGRALVVEDTSQLDHEQISLSGLSAEGSRVTLFKEDGDISVIQAVFFGETRRTEIEYYFDPDDESRHLVEVTEFLYSDPIYVPDSKLASMITSTFMICTSVKPNYPDSIDLASAYSRSEKVLKIILEDQQP